MEVDPAIIAAIISAIAAITVAIVGPIIVFKLNATHKLINSRMDEMLTLTRAMGVSEGREEQRIAQEGE